MLKLKGFREVYSHCAEHVPSGLQFRVPERSPSHLKGLLNCGEVVLQDRSPRKAHKTKRNSSLILESYIIVFVSIEMLSF